jgi:hypothetical protein
MAPTAATLAEIAPIVPFVIAKGADQAPAIQRLG